MSWTRLEIHQGNQVATVWVKDLPILVDLGFMSREDMHRFLVMQVLPDTDIAGLSNKATILPTRTVWHDN